MNLVTIDIETFWSVDYSLTKMSFIEYIKDDRFEIISAAIKINNQPTMVYWGADVGPAVKAIDWANSALIGHNGNEFDFPALVWTYDIHPKAFFDTLALAKPKHQSSVGGSLKALSEHYNLPAKNNAVLLQTKGRHLADFTLQEMRDMTVYNRGDTDNTFALFKIFAKDTSARELALCDMTARMICYPQLHCDIDRLERALVATQAAKQTQLEGMVDVLGALDAEDVRTQLASAPKFAMALESFGVEVPMKVSKTTGLETRALAKSDEAFLALQEHPDERVQMLVACRLGVKSTLLETRLTKMITSARLMGGSMPVPLAYHAATTGRWGGRIWNCQNLPRINPKSPKLSDALRASLVAPPGHKIVVCDLSGIELRVNHYLWDVDSTRELYAGNAEADLYKEFASSLFGKVVELISKDERQLAKVAQLGLGFGAGAMTFRKVAKLMGGIELDEEEAKRVTATWRAKYIQIVKGWKQCQRMIEAMAMASEFQPDPRGLVRGYAVDGEARVRLPSGRDLYYPDLTSEFGSSDGFSRKEYRYGRGRHRSKVYAGLLDENLVQGIARDVIAEQALVYQAETGRLPAFSVHDELIYVVPEDDAEDALAHLQRVMRRAPTWLPGIVLWSEGDIADNYGDAK